MKKAKFLVGALVMVLIILGILVLMYLVILYPVVRNSELDPLKGVKTWEIYRVEESNTRVWCLARRVANNHYNLQEVVILISEKNNLKGDYNLHPGDEILLPVFRKK